VPATEKNKKVETQGHVEELNVTWWEEGVHSREMGEKELKLPERYHKKIGEKYGSNE